MVEVRKLTPNFSVEDVKQTVRFYCDMFDFVLTMAVPETQDSVDESLSDDKEYVFAALVKDNIEMMFQRKNSDEKIGASISFYIEVDDVEGFYNQLKQKNLLLSDLHTTWYGMQEFFVRDNNGYLLCFAQQTKQE